MRVLVATNMWPTEADPTFGVFVREQVKAVREAGVYAEVHFVDGRSASSNYARAILPVRRRLARGDIDLVHAHYVLTGTVAWIAGASRPGRPLVVTHHGVEVFAGWQSALARWLTRRADRTFVISRAMARRLGLSDESVLPCGVDLQLFQPGSRAAARSALGLPTDRPLIAWVGADRPEKRLALAEAAVDLLHRGTADAELLVVTGHPHHRVPLYLQAADALLVTSRWEGGPLVIKEALACNVPVVSTDVGDARELLGRLAGCAVVDGTPQALATGLRQALSHGPVDGRPVVEPYRSEAIAARLTSVYREALAGSAGPR